MLRRTNCPPPPCCGDGSRPQQTEGPPPSPPTPLAVGQWGCLGDEGRPAQVRGSGTVGVLLGGKGGDPPPLVWGGWGVEDGGRPPWLGADRGATPPPPPPLCSGTAGGVVGTAVRPAQVRGLSGRLPCRACQSGMLLPLAA